MSNLPEVNAVLSRISAIESRLASLGSGAPAPEQAASFAQALTSASQRAGLPSALVKAVVQEESGGDPSAVSPAGAQGLMQLMPETAKGLGVSNPFDPQQNLAGGTHYLRSMLDRFHDLPDALAAYNAGPEAVDKYGGVPPYPETRAYVQHVMAAYSSALRGETR